VPPLTGSTIVWVVTGNLSIINGQGTTTATINATSAGTGSVFVTRFKAGHSACADFRMYNIAGAPPAPTNLDIIIEPCETVLVRVNPLVPGATGFNFFVDGVLKQSGTFNDYYISLIVPDIQPGVHTACVSAFNSSGTSSQYCETFQVTCVGGAGNQSIVPEQEYYPIPANNYLTVSETTKVVEFIRTDTGQSISLTPLNGEIDLSMLKNGDYRVIFKDVNGATKIGRVIIIK
jgi:hypothetical protein